MSQVESYLVATIFVAISGFFFGYGMRTVEMLNANQLEKNPNSLFSIFGLIATITLLVYGFRWGFLVDGAYFVWLPALIAWFTASNFGRNLAFQNRSILQPWRLPLIGSLFVAGGFHLIRDYITR
jgi:hypothetical protein